MLALHSMENSFIEFINLENMGVAVGILQLCCIYTGYDISIFGLYVRSHLGILTSFASIVWGIALLNSSRTRVRAAWGKFYELAPVLTKGVSF